MEHDEKDGAAVRIPPPLIYLEAVIAGIVLHKYALPLLLPLAGGPRLGIAIAIVALAIAKAALVGLYYMHLKHETAWLQWTVAVPLAMPAIYALILVAEAAWRLAGLGAA